MIERLLARLDARVILVGGKGGVGKTTTAGAIALALADRGENVQLISTDPAHSLHDLFGDTTCSNTLTLEEFDAHAYADTWMARVRPNLAVLIERGSYLDEGDARGFLDLSLPGIDEVMGALRLVELLRTTTHRIVVDTAPTGHTLRLLESARVLRSWITAGRALADKANTVASLLLRQDVRLEAERTLDDIERDTNAFEHEILDAGAFLLVTREHPVIAAETERYRVQLRERGVRICATITDRTTSPAEDVFVAPRLRQTTGCDALHEWAQRLGEAPTARVQANEPTRSDAEPFIAALKTRLVWVAGKGGVGKSTCAAALASFLAQSRNVLVVSTDPAGSLSEIFQQPIGRDAVQVQQHLHARQIDAPAELAQLRTQYRDAIEEVFAALGLERAVQLDRRVLETLFDVAPPGIDEIIALIDIVEHASEYDVAIIDSAPTGHFLRLLGMPEIALQWVHALMRLAVKYHAVGSLDALAADLLAFAKRLRQMQQDLSAPDTTAVFVVTLAEPMVLAETRRLCTALAQLQIPIAAVVCNRADAGSARALRSDFPAQPVIRAPDHGELVGADALRGFLRQWEMIGE